MSRLEELLANPSPENWREIVEIGKTARRSQIESWTRFCSVINDVSLANWPPEIERLCPESWPKEFRSVVEHRVIETDTYEHYVAKICGDPRLRLSDGKTQAAWLERRFTGGIVSVSTVHQALRSIGGALDSLAVVFKTPASPLSFVKGAVSAITAARNILSNGVRRVGKVGCADLTGGIIVECRCCSCGLSWNGNGACSDSECERGVQTDVRHEYRLEVEVKVGDEPQRPEQVARMSSVRARGGCYVLARSVEEAVQAIIAFRDSH